jgi:hypothetical protein
MNQRHKTSRVRISLSDLPTRSRPLSDAELTDVFGGCQQHLLPCTHSRECCSLRCTPFGPYAVLTCISKRM